MTDDLVKRLRELACNCYDAEVIEAGKDAMDEAASRIEMLEAALEKISRERTLWGAMRKADHALGRFEQKALEGKDD